MTVVPKAVVEMHEVRRRVADHEDVEVACTVQIGRENAAGAGTATDAGDARHVGEPTVPIVVEDRVWSVGVGEHDVEIAVMVGINDRDVPRIEVAAGRVRGARDVNPTSRRGLEEEPIGSASSEIRIGATVLVDVRE